MEQLKNGIKNKEDLDYLSFGDATKKLGQSQYISRFVNPNEELRTDGTPFFEDIRISGNPDDYHSIKIHKDDVFKFIEKWFDYKKKTSFLFKERKIEDFF